MPPRRTGKPWAAKPLHLSSTSDLGIRAELGFKFCRFIPVLVRGKRLTNPYRAVILSYAHELENYSAQAFGNGMLG